MIKVAIFIDGKNFYKSLRAHDPNIIIDYKKFAQWLCNKVGGENARMVGAYYYTGYAPDSGSPSEKLHHFLEGLDRQEGYNVRYSPLIYRKMTCKHCGKEIRYTTEKRVDTRLVSEILQLGAVDAFDVAVLISGDQDFVPAVKALNTIGKQVYIATWGGHGLSRELRSAAFGEVNLIQGKSEFVFQRQTDVITNMKKEINLAHSWFSQKNGFLGKSFFVEKWIPKFIIPAAGAEREELLNKMIERGQVEEYKVSDATGKMISAIRVPEREQYERIDRRADYRDDYQEDDQQYDRYDDSDYDTDDEDYEQGNDQPFDDYKPSEADRDNIQQDKCQDDDNIRTDDEDNRFSE